MLDLLFSWIVPLAYPFMPSERVFVGYMATAFLPVFYIAWKRNNWQWDFDKFWETCFPKALWTHPSTIVDFKYFFVNTAIFTALIVPYISASSLSSEFTYGLLGGVFGAPEHQFSVTTFAVVGFTVVLLLLGDFALFLSHFLQHRVSFLWEFHKVHHSAQVLTPIAVYRMHPIDDLLAIFLGGLFMGIGIGAAQYLFVQTPSVSMVAGLNIFTFLFYIFLYNLRHSHFWIHYGEFWGRIFISPAQHQIHHSSEQRHWDKNFGFMFAFWDNFFGCLYNPKEREEFVLGIGAETGEYNSVKALYFLPFTKNWQRFKKSWHKGSHEKISTDSTPPVM